MRSVVVAEFDGQPDEVGQPLVPQHQGREGGVEDRIEDGQRSVLLAALFGHESLGDQQEVAAFPFRAGGWRILLGRVEVPRGHLDVFAPSGDQRADAVRKQCRRPGFTQPVEGDRRAVLGQGLQCQHGVVPAAHPVVVHRFGHLQAA